MATSVQVLQRYLSAGIECRFSYGGIELQKKICNLDPEGFVVFEGGILLTVNLVTPILKPFEALTKPLPGLTQPAAVTLAILTAQTTESKTFRSAKVTMDAHFGKSICLEDRNLFQVYIQKSKFVKGKYHLEVLEWLWANGFAVGLNAEEYIVSSSI